MVINLCKPKPKKMHGLKGNSLPFFFFNLNDRLKGNFNQWENRLM